MSGQIDRMIMTGQYFVFCIFRIVVFGPYATVLVLLDALVIFVLVGSRHSLICCEDQLNDTQEKKSNLYFIHLQAS